MYSDLQAEGWARDFVRFVQDGRKKAGFDILDRIEVKIFVPPDIREAIIAHEPYIKKQTLSESIQYVETLDGMKEVLDGRYQVKEEIEGSAIIFEVRKLEKGPMPPQTKESLGNARNGKNQYGCE